MKQPPTLTGQTLLALAILIQQLMRVLFAISILSFCALAWAALAIARHIRRTTSPAEPHPVVPASPSRSTFTSSEPTLSPSATRKLRPHTPQRHDHTYASADSGNLLDPGARANVRPRRKS